MTRTKRLALMGLLTCIALALHTAEAMLPALIPLPGVKPGLANIVTLAALRLSGRRDAGLILFARILLGSLFAGGASTLMFSAAGGLCAFLVMAPLHGRFPDRMLWVPSALGAIAHSAGQLAAALLVTGTPSILWYAFPLLAASVAAGVFTGLAAGAALRLLRAHGRRGDE